MTHIPADLFHDLNQTLSETELKSHPSQVHGLICGILSAHSKKLIDWKALVVGEKPEPHVSAVINDLYNNSLKQLADFLFEFQLILPDDSFELGLRAEALTLWCQGYLTGLKLADVKLMNRTPSDVTEAINDMIEIAKMKYEEVVVSEEDEKAYTELVEYIRMAVILIYQELNDSNPKSGTAASPLH